MTMDDYADLRDYWAANPPLQALAAAFLGLKPKRVRRAAPAEAAAESMRSAFPDGLIR